MYITHLSLSHFRKFTKEKLSFSPQTTILLGDNASGKTSILEAIFLLAAGKSFRAEQDMEMISFESEIGRVQGEITGSTNEKIQLEIVLTKGETMGIKTPFKKCLINGVGKRIIDFVGTLKTVLFWPEDLELVTDSPSLRRRYLDFVLTQVDREYRRSLISYEKGLRQRNRLLEAIRDAGANHHQLMFWDQLLIKTGAYITQKREEYIDYLNRYQGSGIRGQLNIYQLVYDRSIISEARLAQYKYEEVAAGVTLVGPHRDDIEFRIMNHELGIKGEDYRNLSHFGSRGEQRLAVLWLKLGELAFIEDKTGEKPVLLLDDILSELDHSHRKIIFEVIGNQQTILSTTDGHFIDKHILKDVQVIDL